MLLLRHFTLFLKIYVSCSLNNLLKILWCGRQKRLPVFNPLSGKVDVLAESIVLQPATHLLFGPLAEWDIHITIRNKSKGCKIATVFLIELW